LSPAPQAPVALVSVRWRLIAGSVSVTGAPCTGIAGGFTRVRLPSLATVGVKPIPGVGGVGVVGVGGEEAVEGLDAVVVIVEHVALDADAVGEEIRNMEGRAGGGAEGFEDAAEGRCRKGGIGVGRGGGQNAGRLPGRDGRRRTG